MVQRLIIQFIKDCYPHHSKTYSQPGEPQNGITTKISKMAMDLDSQYEESDAQRYQPLAASIGVNRSCAGSALSKIGPKYQGT